MVVHGSLDYISVVNIIVDILGSLSQQSMQVLCSFFEKN